MISHAQKVRTRSSCSFSKLNSSMCALSRYRGRITVCPQSLYANIFRLLAKFRCNMANTFVTFLIFDISVT